MTEMQLMARKMWSCRVRILSGAWDAGRELIALKNLTPPDEWQPRLEKAGMSQAEAYLLMRLYEGYPDKTLLCNEFGGVQEALEALPPKRAKADGDLDD